jgi:hypothetical protein
MVQHLMKPCHWSPVQFTCSKLLSLKYVLIVSISFLNVLEIPHNNCLHSSYFHHLKYVSEIVILVTIFLSLDWDEVKSFGASTFKWSIVLTQGDRGRKWNVWWNENWWGKLKYSVKICSSTTLPTTYPT